jgi:hypothetical protein
MTEGKKGVLVCCDGRTIAVDNCNGARWWVLARDMDYSNRRVFKLADIARMIPNPEHPIFVYVERPMIDWDKDTDRHARPSRGTE